MEIKEIINAMNNDNVVGNIPFSFVAIDDGHLCISGRAYSIEEEIFMLVEYMQMVRNIITQHAEECGLGEIDFSDTKKWITFLCMLQCAVDDGKYKDLFDMSGAKTSVTKLMFPKAPGKD